MTESRCNKVTEQVVDVLHGSIDEAFRAHVASCDDCRDAAHALERVSSRVASAGDDFAPSPSRVERLVRLASECAAPADAEDEGARVSETRIRAEGQSAEPPSETSRSGGIRRRTLWFALAACISVGASSLVGGALAERHRSQVVSTRFWHGSVVKVSRSGAASGDGLTVVTASGKTSLAEGAEIGPGTRLATDSRTRARLSFDDGSFVVLDRSTEVVVENAPRTMSVVDGTVLADVANVEGASLATFKTSGGDVRVLGTKFAVTATPDRSNVEVLRGEVEIVAERGRQKVSAGQEGVISRDGEVDVAPANDLAQRVAFGEQLLSSHNEDTEMAVSGLGELRAKRPGRSDEKDRAVRLQKHAVKVRIAGNVARTEIDETFANDTDDELEGIYRFPLPPGAQIERLALEVDGKLLDGEFIDKSKASAIWRGAIQNAAPKAPKPKEEIVWVPGPWHDPALLEWQRGGRFELRIFPIPKRGSRRVVIAYTETVAPVSGIRRYVYPLPQGASSELTIDEFSVDAQVIGHDIRVPVRVRGYELPDKSEGSVARLGATMGSFTPSGDLLIEYALDDKRSDATVWAYRAEPSESKAKDPVGDDPFVAIALRPKLPRWSEGRPRDQVIVVDVGRSMYGERFARAKRLAVQMIHEMDRRDRVTVVACDVTCRSLPGGFVAPGGPSAHDVDAFVAGITPDGASDLVGAVRVAATMPGRDRDRDLRITVLSDGVATAGYRSPSRVASEVADTSTAARAVVFSVPIGADADVNLLSEIARGGGGVVVPYQPGQRLEATALDVLNATYGTTLRDVEIVLPPGLYDAAPAVLPPLRAGSETLVAARMKGDSVKGDLVLRGKVGEELFEAKYPIDVRSSSDAGNAFVPRLFASSRIADRERQLDGGSHAELVALSRRFSVPSRATSLLVLESEAMFKAFGIARADHAPRWTGEVEAQGSQVASDRAGDLDDLEEEPSAGLGALGFDERKKGDARAGASSPSRLLARPSATAAPAKDARLDADDRASSSFAEQGARPPPSPPARAARVRPPGGRFMKKVYVRRATLSATGAPLVVADKIAQAREAVAKAPDERSKHKELAKLLAISGQLDELETVLDKWSLRDPLDVDVIVGRSDVAARRGDRGRSLRIWSGALSATSLSTAEAFAMAQAIGRSYDRLALPEACAFHVAAAELRSDSEAIARAVLCERSQGRARATDRWFYGLTEAQKKSVTAAIAKLEVRQGETATGDIVVSATWSGGLDLDVSLIDPTGRRVSALTRLKGVRASGVDARDHEVVALSNPAAGALFVEVLRANASDGLAPVSGVVKIKALGQTQSIPFALKEARTQVARVDVRWDTELVPVDEPPFDPIPARSAFDHAAAASALANVSLRHCSASGQSGTGHVTVTFEPTGRASDVVVDDATFKGTPAGRCVQAAFLVASVPPFVGSQRKVGKSFSLVPSLGWQER